MPPKTPAEKTGIQPRAEMPVSLQKGEYQNTLNLLREDVKNQRKGYIDVQLQLPFGKKPVVHLLLRCTNAYIIGFLGKDKLEKDELGNDKTLWYRFEDESGDGWAQDKPSCRVSGKYPNNVEPITHERAKKLAEFTQFNGSKGSSVSPGLIVIAAAVVSESLRFAEVARQFTKLFDGGGTSVQVGPLMTEYFLRWKKLTEENKEGVVLLPCIP